MATTHFEATFARHAFPCYDEPQTKAKFTISIIHKPKYHVISNMNEKDSVDHPNELKKTTFYETKDQSTYLIAFAITDFAMKQNQSNSNDEYSKTLVRVYTRPHWIQYADLALQSGIESIAEIGRYLGVPYALDKIDQIAGPIYNGAMENWGLVTYKLVVAIKKH